jgi:type II secretory pathway component GspD/PulD (secretin)
MSRPNIITTNNRRARINNSIEVPVPTDISTTNTGTLSSFKYRDVGLILDVTPTVSVESGLVVMDTQLTTGSVLGSDPVRVGDTEFNRFTKREIRTNIGVKGAETVVIGGVISEDKSTIDKKVPFLGSVPVMGALFRNSRDVRTKSELITFITPYIIEKPADMYEVTKKQRDRIKAFELLESESIKNHLESVMKPEEPPKAETNKEKKRAEKQKTGRKKP